MTAHPHAAALGERLHRVGPALLDRGRLAVVVVLVVGQPAVAQQHQPQPGRPARRSSRVGEDVAAPARPGRRRRRRAGRPGPGRPRRGRRPPPGSARWPTACRRTGGRPRVASGDEPQTIGIEPARSSASALAGLTNDSAPGGSVGVRVEPGRGLREVGLVDLDQAERAGRQQHRHGQRPQAGPGRRAPRYRDERRPRPFGQRLQLGVRGRRSRPAGRRGGPAASAAASASGLRPRRGHGDDHIGRADPARDAGAAVPDDRHRAAGGPPRWPARRRSARRYRRRRPRPPAAGPRRRARRGWPRPASAADSRTCAPADAVARSMPAGSAAHIAGASSSSDSSTCRCPLTPAMPSTRWLMPAPPARVPGLVEQQDRDAVADLEDPPALGAGQRLRRARRRSAGRGACRGRPGCPAVAGRGPPKRLLAYGRLGDPIRGRSRASRRAARPSASGVAASTLSRSNGSVFDGAQVEPAPSGSVDGQPVERRRTGRPANAARTCGDLRRRRRSTVELISPEAAYRSYSRGQLGQRPVLLAERGQDVHRGQHAGVGEPEVAEVVVRGVLAAEDRVGPGHLGLDERVPDPGADRHAAVLARRSPAPRAR